MPITSSSYIPAVSRIQIIYIIMNIVFIMLTVHSSYILLSDSIINLRILYIILGCGYKVWLNLQLRVHACNIPGRPGSHQPIYTALC